LGPLPAGGARSGGVARAGAIGEGGGGGERGGRADRAPADRTHPAQSRFPLMLPRLRLGLASLGQSVLARPGAALPRHDQLPPRVSLLSVNRCSLRPAPPCGATTRCRLRLASLGRFVP